eukprot:288923-Pleurochrysis_carterae.AAC.1
MGRRNGEAALGSGRRYRFGFEIVRMPRRRLRKHLVGVVFAFIFASGCVALFREPTCALSSGGFRVVVGLLAVLWLNHVLVVAIHLPLRLRVDVGHEDGTVAVEWMRLSGVVAGVVILLSEIGQVLSRGDGDRAIAPVSVVLGAGGETFELVRQ